MAMSSTMGPAGRGAARTRGLLPMMRSAPPQGGGIGHGVVPADADEAGFGGLPAVSAGAHPVIGVGERDAADAVLAAEGEGAVHAGEGVEIAGTAAAIPALERAMGGEEGGFGTDDNAAVADGGDVAGKAVDAVGVNAVTGGFGKEAGAGLGAVGREAEFGEDGRELLLDFVEGDAVHGVPD